MSTGTTVKIYEQRPSRWQYLLQVLRYTPTLTFFRALVYLFFFYVVNHVKGVCKAHVGKATRICPTALLRDAERIFIGSNCTINHNNILWAGRKAATIRIGNNVMIGPNVTILAYNHYCTGGKPMLEHFTEADVVIGDDVWIGAGVVILAGAKVGEGSVVGAGAVVVGELPPHSVCAGVPAKVIKRLQETRGPAIATS